MISYPYADRNEVIIEWIPRPAFPNDVLLLCSSISPNSFLAAVLYTNRSEPTARRPVMPRWLLPTELRTKSSKRRKSL